MKSVLIGVGQAGGKVATALSAFDERNGFGAVHDALAVNSAQSDLRDLPLDAVLVGAATVNGHGVGGDNELGTAVMRNDVNEVLDAVADRVTSETEAIFVVAGLGGGTGSGGAPYLAKELARVYDTPVYGLGILPGRDEGALYRSNAGRSLRTLSREADATLLVDNDAWRSAGESLASGYETINERIARRVGLLLAAGETVDGVGESVVDGSEISNTFGSGGVASLGYAATEAAPDAADNVSTTVSATRRAVRSGLSLPDSTRAERALLVVAGPPAAIPRKGVERARSWLESELDTMAVRGGDFPLAGDRLISVILLGGVSESERLESFLERARRADRERQETAERTLADERLDSLL
jgi:cell division GTPase FtsZ